MSIEVPEIPKVEDYITKKYVIDEDGKKAIMELVDILNELSTSRVRDIDQRMIGVLDMVIENFFELKCVPIALYNSNKNVFEDYNHSHLIRLINQK